MKIADLSAKQIIGCLGYYNSYVDKSVSFTKFLDSCEFGQHSHENAPIIYKAMATTESGLDTLHFKAIDHGFYNLYASEEDEIVTALLQNLHHTND